MSHTTRRPGRLDRTGETPRTSEAFAYPASSPALRAPAPPRSPWQLLYGGAHRLRRAWYSGRARRLPRPVVSVGNLHWGGTGKTPLVAALAAHLRDAGLGVCLLSRGYGRRGGGLVLVSAGEGPLVGPLLAGDEPALLAGELPGVAVMVGAGRYEAGLAALARLPQAPDLFLLDDGFSHLALARDLDLLAFPAADPFAGGRLLPAGRLREPLASAARADAVLLTGAEPGGAGGEELAAALARYAFRGPGFACASRLGPPVWVEGRGELGREDGRAEVAPGTRVLAVAGVARPGPFFAGARAAGLEVVGERVYPDHHAYPEATLAEIRTAFAECGAEAVLATAKDRVKLLRRLELPLAELPLAAEPEPAFWTWLDGRIAALVAAAGRAGGGPR